MPYALSNGIHVHFEEFGSGEPILMIMGLSADAGQWLEHRTALEPYFHCICPDNRGVGLTDKPLAPYTIGTMADDAVGVLDALGIRSAHVFGVSMGGAIAQEIAINYPDRVKSLILMATFSESSPRQKRITGAYPALRETLPPKMFCELMQALTYSERYHDTHMDDLQRREAESLCAPNPQPLYAYAAQCGACMGHNATARLHKITAPTLVLGGEEDELHIPENSRVLHRGIAGSELRFFPGGHCFHFENPEAVNEAILSFLRRQSGQE